MNWITKLERKYGRFCIPNLINILIGGQILVYAIELFVNQYISFYSAKGHESSVPFLCETKNGYEK